MKNLKIVHDVVKEIDNDLPLTSTTWDPTSDSILFTLGPTALNQGVELRRISAASNRTQENSILIAAWDAPCPLPSLDCDHVLDHHYFPHTETSCLVLAGGDIVNVRHSPLPDEERIEIVGSVDEGITAAAWSPDEELLVLSTGADTFLFMTIDFENVASVKFSSDDGKLSKHVSVGWGKKETQFQGKRAKALRDPTMPEKVDEGVLDESDSERTSISWRGDGAYVAVNSIIMVDDKQRRMIRVYSREGTLDSVTEPVDRLTGALSWRPAGNLIAGIQHVSALEVNVVFFERNGLRHGQFSLRSPSTHALDNIGSFGLAWNIDSSALAVCMPNQVQIWTMGNYHYYLKQQIYRTRASNGTMSDAMFASWHPEQAHRISTFGLQSATKESVPAQNTLRVTSMVPYVCTCSPVSPFDYGTTVVIDGSRLKITPLRTANVPPPMALYEVDLGDQIPIIDVAVNQTGSQIAVLTKQMITILALDAKEIGVEPRRIHDITDIPIDVLAHSRQICFGADDELLVVFSHSPTGEDRIYNIKYSNTVRLSEPTQISILLPSIEHDKLYAAATDSVLELMLQDQSEVAETKFISTCPNSVTNVGVVEFEGEPIACCLSATGILYANDRLLVKNCTSFVVTKAHIIFTTTNHLLKFVHLTNVSNLQIPPDEPETDERCRTIERGARLIAVMPTSCCLTLQMPRGNLETIYPRALVLASIRRNIEQRQYRKAFLTCRSQRVDMNIIHDYAPDQFLKDVKLVVQQLKSVGHIDLFLAQLTDKDVSKTLYQETLTKSQVNGESQGHGGNVKEQTGIETPGKVNRICDAFLEVLKHMQETNLQNIITANTCKMPPNIEAGLSVVADLSKKDEPSAESALEHMCFLTDVNVVYDRALGMYDLDLALLVAQQSQKDPREYLPYLQSLQNLEPLRRQFTIDNDLKRYKSALTHLKTLNSFEEVKKFTQKHELYRDALDLYRYSYNEWQSLLRLHADFLNSWNHFKEAGILYESLSILPLALSAYKQDPTLWESALTVASLIPLPAADLTSLAEDLRATLAEQKDFIPAATISLDYLHDPPTAISHLCAAYKPTRALRIATSYTSNITNNTTSITETEVNYELAATPPTSSSTNLLTTSLDPSLASSAGDLTELLSDCRAQCIAQTTRLREVRLIKAQDPLQYFGETPQGQGGDKDTGIPDDISLAGTESSLSPSLFTRYGAASSMGLSTLQSGVSRKTSKNRRREERKRARGKKGSVYEEEYLVSSIERLITRVEKSREDVQEVVQVLCRRGMWELAKAVEKSMVEVVDLLRDAVTWVFERKDNVSAGERANGIDGNSVGDAIGVNDRPMGGQGVYWDHLQIEGGRVRRDTPVIAAYQPSILL